MYTYMYIYIYIYAYITRIHDTHILIRTYAIFLVEARAAVVHEDEPRGALTELVAYYYY